MGLRISNSRPTLKRLFPNERRRGEKSDYQKSYRKHEAWIKDTGVPAQSQRNDDEYDISFENIEQQYRRDTTAKGDRRKTKGEDQSV